MLPVDKWPLSIGGLKTTGPGCLRLILADYIQNILPEKAWRGNAPESKTSANDPLA